MHAATVERKHSDELILADKFSARASNEATKPIESDRN
jgi:hypothetical protein